MSAAVSPISPLLTVFSKNGLFAFRRGDKSEKAITDGNILYGIANADIAAAQTYKSTLAALSVLPTASACMSIKALNQSANKFAPYRELKKVIKFTAKNINPLICAASGIKVAVSDDKVDTAAREALSLSSMFAAEAAARKLLGMPDDNKAVNKESYNMSRKYSNITVEKNIKRLRSFCETKKLFGKISLKGAPGMIKGVMFVGASIGGYALGAKVADSLLGSNNQVEGNNNKKV